MPSRIRRIVMASGFQLRAMDVMSAFRRTVTVRLKPDTTYGED
jgi:hypothetical protein